MTRYKRKEAISRIYHIIIRGNERREIFIDDYDRLKFLGLIEKNVWNECFEIFAYCLMSNHIHLLVKENNEQLSTIMKSIEVSYVHYFNKKYERVGHLFQDRFKSEPVESDKYLLTCIKYIHYNPVAAGIVEKENEFKWSSYIYYTRNYEDCFVNTSFVLKVVSDNIEMSRRLLMENNLEDNITDMNYVPIDIIDDNENNNYIQTVNKNIEEFLFEYLTRNDLTIASLKHKKYNQHRTEIITKLIMNFNISNRRIAEILDLNRSVIDRTKQFSVRLGKG